MREFQARPDRVAADPRARAGRSLVRLPPAACQAALNHRAFVDADDGIWPRPLSQPGSDLGQWLRVGALEPFLFTQCERQRQASSKP